MATTKAAKTNTRSKSTKKKTTEAKPSPASSVESHYLELSAKPLRCGSEERIGIIEVNDFPSLGRLTALRFLEWVLENPNGVISLPTGKTPEFFIKWTQHFLENWETPVVKQQLEAVGLGGKPRPEMGGLHFVQIDEFYPIDPAQHNSFYYYVMKHYIRGFGLDPAKALLIDPTAIGLKEGQTIDDIFPGGQVDLSLRSRHPRKGIEFEQQRVIREVDQFCSEYEDKVQALGGIGFFLGGIGPDGHIGFNARGSHLHTPTRLTLTNYETEAAAASDLGGIEVSRGKPVITIGLGTITHNPDATIIIFAAGEAKAPIAADAILNERNVLYPASALQPMPNARFYITHGAAIHLRDRKIHEILANETIPEATLEKAVVDRTLALGKRLDKLKAGDEKNDPLLQAILRRTDRNLAEVAGWARERLITKINRGLDTPEYQTILHTGPHHDDIMLGYMPYVMHLVRKASNENIFTVLTSGFTAVTNQFLASVLGDAIKLIEQGEFDADEEAGAFNDQDPGSRAEEVYRFLDGIAARREDISRRWQARRALYNAIKLYEDDSLTNIAERLRENLNYLKTLYPGKKDIPIIQNLKGRQREYEEELIWGYVGTPPEKVMHMRLGFYTGDIFTESPTIERDVQPILELLLKLKPTIVSLAFDPEGAGPDTHYKVLQALHDALLLYHEKTGNTPDVWGYRNVWHRFHPADASIFIPTTLNTMAIMEHSFMNCFGSQRNASFPSYEYDGPFCRLAEAIWVKQFQDICVCLGERFFIENPHPRLRATRGFVFLAGMTLEEFSGQARSLAKAMEGVEMAK